MYLLIETHKRFSVYIQLFTTFGVQNFEKLRIHNGFLPATYAENANRCFEELKKQITPDGYLKGAAQDNRGGMRLQESDYRVIAQMGMGLMAQLYAEII